jgi:DNA-binding response OmpR family regulator
LIVTDDPKLKRRIAAALQADGQEVVEIPGSGERVNRFAAALSSDPGVQPDILVSTLRTAGDTDLEALIAVPRSRRIPMVLIAPRDDDATRLKAYRLGAEIVLAEPLDIDELLISVLALVPEKG